MTLDVVKDLLKARMKGLVASGLVEGTVDHRVINNVCVVAWRVVLSRVGSGSSRHQAHSKGRNFPLLHQAPFVSDLGEDYFLFMVQKARRRLDVLPSERAEGRDAGQNVCPC